MASSNRDECTKNSVEDLAADGHSTVHIENNYTEAHSTNKPNRNRCLADLRLGNPRNDKTRIEIEQTKGGLLKDSYKWILDHVDFRRRRRDRESRLLWIKGAHINAQSAPQVVSKNQYYLHMLNVQKFDFSRVLVNGPRDGPYQANIIIVEGGEPTSAGEQKFTPSAPSSYEASIECLAREIPEARVWTYSYETMRSSGKASSLVYRVKEEIWNEDPILFVSHSRGEIAVRQAVGEDTTCERRTKLIIFLGTPEQQKAHRKCIQEKPMSWRQDLFDATDRGFKAAVDRSGIRVYSVQEAQGTGRRILRREHGIDDGSPEPDLQGSLGTVESMNASHSPSALSNVGSGSDGTYAHYQSVVSVLKQSIPDEAASESKVREDGLSTTAVGAQIPTAAICRSSVDAPVATAQVLCQICSNIHFRRVWESGFPESRVKAHCDFTHWSHGSAPGMFYYIHHESKDALSASAKNGCHLCSMLWTVLSDLDFRSFEPWRGIKPDPPGKVLIAFDGPCLEEVHSSGSIPIQVKCADRVIKGQIGPTYADAAWEKSERRPIIFHDITKALTFCSELDKTTTSAANALLARTWLENCLDHHRPCGDRNEHPTLPRRVIDLADPQAFRLVSGSGLRGKYIALSYKWGGIVKCTTTSHNYRERMRRLPVEHLPQTFRQAIQITRDLGISYLWIDALCIIQDSKEELEEDISSMDQVYQNATLTIFAAGAENVDSGFSVRRNPLGTRACQLDVKYTNHGQTRCTTSLISFYEDLVVPGPYPLFRRGWVLQEQILSRRCLIFGTRFVSWECICNRSSEKWPTVTTAETMKAYRASKDPISQMRLAVTTQQNDKPRVFDIWYDMVKNYHRRALTNPVDVLPALTGLANAIGRSHQATYASGLWLEDLQAGLSWFVQKSPDARDALQPTVKGTSQNPNRLPSWTWASRWGCEIQFRGDLGWDLFLRCDGIEMDNTGYGVHKKGTMILNGCLKPAEARWLPSGCTMGDKHLQDPAWVGLVYDPESGQELGKIAYDEKPESVDVMAISCLLCSRGQWYKLSDDWHVSCLALVPTTPTFKDTYRRLGLVFLNEYTWFGARWARREGMTSIPRLGTIERSRIRLV